MKSFYFLLLVVTLFFFNNSLDLQQNWEKWKWLSRVQLFATPWTIQPMEFSRPEYWSGSFSLLQGIFPTQESIRGLLQADSLSTELQGSPNKIEKEVKVSPVPIASTVINIIYWNSTFFFLTKDEPTLTLHNHPMLIVFLKVGIFLWLASFT